MPRRKTLKLSAPADIRRAISRVANMVLNEEITPTRADVLIAACNAALRAFKTDEQEKKLVELEGLLSTMEGR